jgi:uncharacterized integral membrane protein (TIGR00698 family)
VTGQEHTIETAPGCAQNPARASAIPGFLVAVAVAVAATFVGRLVPLVGAPVVAIVIGVGLSRFLRGRDALEPGLRFSATTVLQLAVVVLGAQLSLREVADVGVSSLPVMLGTLAACLLVAWLVGRRLGIDRDLNVLIGVGTAICGASAIAALSPVIKARSHAVAYAVSTIFVFNIAAVLTFPALGHLLGLSQSEFGLFAGTAVNDTSSVVAAATTYGAAAGNHAIVVKLVRTLMIIPIGLALGAITERRAAREAGVAASRRLRVPAVPWFLVGFVVVAAVNSLGLIPAAAHHGLQQTSVVLITVALAGIGASTDFAGLRRAGVRPLLLGAILWVVVAATSLALQAAF